MTTSFATTAMTLPPLVASCATTLPPPLSAREAHFTPRHSGGRPPAPWVTSSARTEILSPEEPEGDSSTLQAECSRLREELVQERAERCALAMRVDALSKMWEASGLHGETQVSGSPSKDISQLRGYQAWGAAPEQLDSPNTSMQTIMGCIVNGPGEMADADFGYVG